MKKILFLSLILSFQSFGQDNKIIDLGNFVNKKIVSDVILHLHENDTRTSGGCCLFVEQTSKMTIVKKLKRNAKSNEIVVEKELLRLTAEDGNGETLYDSENLFDRSAIISVGYSQFDKMVKKPLTYSFDNKGKRLDTLKKDLTYEETYLNNIFNGGVYAHYLNYYWSEVFQTALPIKLDIGETIKDHYLGTKSDFINDYTVLSVKNNEVLLSIKGARLPKKVAEGNRFDTKLFISGRSIYEGTILYDFNNLLIKELNIVHRKDNTNYSNNKEMDYTSTQDINVKNRIEDL